MDREAALMKMVDDLRAICESLTNRLTYANQRIDILREEVNHLIEKKEEKVTQGSDEFHDNRAVEAAEKEEKDGT